MDLEYVCQIVSVWRKTLGYGCLLLLVLGSLTLVSSITSAAPIEGSGWVNLYNMTGIETPEIVRLSYDGSTACIHDKEAYFTELWDVHNESMKTYMDISGTVTDIEFSPDGSMIAIGRGPGFESLGLVIFWASNGTQVPGTHVHTMNYTDDLDWSPDGERIALGTREGEVFIINTKSWEISAEMRFQDAGRIVSIAFSPDGTSLAFLSSNGICTILDADTMEVKEILDERPAEHFHSELSWSTDGNFICYPWWDGVVAVYNTTSFEMEELIYYRSASFSPTRNYLLAGPECLDIADWTNVKTFRGVVGEVLFNTWSGDGNSLALGSPDDTTVRVFVDTDSPAYDHPPRVHIDSPGPGETISSTEVEFNGTSTDDGSVEFVIARIDDHPWFVANGTSNWSWMPPYEELDDGFHLLQVRAYDGTLFSNTCSTRFILNLGSIPNVKPWVTLKYPENGLVMEQPFPVYGLTGDDVAVEFVNISLANVTVEVQPDNLGIWEAVLPWNDLPVGSLILSIRAFDGELWSDYVNASVVVRKDSTEPKPPHVSVHRPVNLEYVQGVVEFAGEAYPPVPEGIVLLQIDGSSMRLAEDYANWTCSVDTRDMGPGRHGILVWAFDGALPSAKVGLTIIVEEYVYVDVLVNSPENNTEVKGSVICTGTVIGSDVIYDVRLRVDQDDPSTVDGTRSWEYELDTTTLEDGQHRLELWATYAGGRSNSSIVFVTVNNSGPGLDLPPSVTISSPSNGTGIEDKVRIQGTATDDHGIDYVQMRIDDGQWVQVDGTESWSFDFEPDSVSEGRHTITVRAFDGGQYSPPISHEYNIVTSGSPVYSGTVLLVLFVVAIVVIAALVYIRTRDRRRD